jgi:death-on-curing protein
MTEPLFLTLDQVRLLHQMALERHGGQEGIRDLSTLESAVMHPRNIWYYRQGDLFDLAAGYAFHLAEAQAFFDGNKRAAVAASFVFLEMNGFSVPEATEEFYAAMIGIAQRRVTRKDLAVILRRLCHAA